MNRFKLYDGAVQVCRTAKFLQIQHPLRKKLCLLPTKIRIGVLHAATGI